MTNTLFRVAHHAGLSRTCYAVWDEDDESYSVYNGPDWLTADYIGTAFSVQGCKLVAREWFAELCAESDVQQDYINQCERNC